MKAVIINSNIVIDHFGYDEDQYDQGKKRKRNLPLLQRMIKDNPYDFFPHFLLGQHYSGDTNTQEKAIHYIEKFLNMNSNEPKLIASAYTTLADIYFSKNDLFLAKDKVKKSLETAPNQLVAFYQFAKIEFAQKRYQKAVDYLEDLCERLNDIRSFKSENALDTVFTKNHINGFFIKIIMFNLNQEKSLRLMVNLWISCEGYGEMSQIFYEWDDLEREKFIQNIVSIGHSEPHWKILNEISGFLHLMKNDYEGAYSVFQNLFDHEHRNTFTIKSLAGIHAKLGKIDEAAALLSLLS
jgi:tetratricopeptide (TPR) repeat protein